MMVQELSKRQEECLRLSAFMSDKEIARELSITDDTVGKHIGAAMRKFGVTNRKAALRLQMGANVPYPSSPVSAVADGGQSLAVDVDQSPAPQTGANSDDPSLYGRYQRSGTWRTPPRSAAFRTKVIFGWILFGLVILLLGLAVVQMLFGGTSGFAPAANPS